MDVDDRARLDTSRTSRRSGRAIGGRGLAVGGGGAGLLLLLVVALLGGDPLSALLSGGGQPA